MVYVHDTCALASSSQPNLSLAIVLAVAFILYIVAASIISSVPIHRVAARKYKKDV